MKRERYISVTVLLAALMLTACSGNDEPTALQQDDELISYTVSSADTRSNVISGTSFPADKSFRVWAYDQTNGNTVIGGDIVSSSGGGVWSTQQRYYWPQANNVTFYMLYPTSLSLSPSMTFSYTMPADVAKQEDVLYDTETANKTDSRISHNAIKRYALPVKFHHALSQVSFKGRVSAENPNWTVEVSGITLCNIYGTGTFYIRSKTWSALSGLTSTAIGIREAGTLVYSSGADPVNLTAANGALLVIPQKLTAWDTKSNVSETTGCYLAVNCHINNGTTDIVGSDEKHQTVYVPFDNVGTSWEQGRRYTYTLQFGSGLDADGNERLYIIVVESEITDWAVGEDSSIDAKMTTED